MFFVTISVAELEPAFFCKAVAGAPSYFGSRSYNTVCYRYPTKLAI